MSTSGFVTSAGIRFKQADHEDLQTLWELRQHLTTKQAPVTRHTEIIRHFQETDPGSDLSSHRAQLSLSQARLEPVKWYVLDHPLVQLYDQVIEVNERRRSFEATCKKDAAKIDEVAESQDPKHWTGIVSDYFQKERNRRDSKAWRPMIAATETNQAQIARRRTEDAARRWRREQQARWREEEIAERGQTAQEIEDERLQVTTERRDGADKKEDFRREAARNAQRNRKLERLGREMDLYSVNGIPTLPLLEPYLAKATTGGPGLSRLDRDFSRREVRAPTPPPPTPAQQRIKRKDVERRARRRSPSTGGDRQGGSRSRSTTPKPREPGLAPELD